MKRACLLCLFMFTAVSVGQSQTQPEQPLTFVADLRGEWVAPAAVDTTASAKATAVLVGRRFTVHGSFSGLSSPLRDLEKTPDDPGVHLHRGAPGEVTPYFHGLQVRFNRDERSGIFYGTAILDDDQLRRLLATELYVDIHTVTHGPGEVRDQWRPLDTSAARKLAASLQVGTEQTDPVTPGACHGS